MNDWIRSDDQRPRKNQRVWAWYSASKQHSGVTWQRSAAGEVVYWGPSVNGTDAFGWSINHMQLVMDRHDMDTATITHWMPLPDPPVSSGRDET